MAIRVTIWNEFRHEQQNEQVKEVYPDGIHEALASYLNKCKGITTKTATLDEPEHGLTDDVLENTDVLIWWGHTAHHEVDDAVVEKVYNRVHAGMGLIALHSAHFSKIFKKLMGTTCDLKWREANDKERLWVTAPNHPIAQGIGDYIELPAEEMYGEFFDIPQPDHVIFTSWFTGGEVFRSGCTFTRSNGKIFYFRPGHETYPTYYNEEILHVIENGVRWAAPVDWKDFNFGNAQPLEDM
ncbi:trehalose utilization protein ThuA [Bacillaceae bacterium SIJ1]|uniref:ThuA domain-containing protein n=1 Tax=Litoribacterium kuwaitense TaxID=1398745 RepID=UPI0013ED60A8|nr:ThuA domain-containing protein [Litoribacterium kuwaitense]NGP44501.1 trehalose utilization protein ThuA [Litoribacterium kuwaitense]